MSGSITIDQVRAEDLLESARTELRRTHPRSTAQYEEFAKRPIIGSTRSRFWPIPIYVDHAQGARVVDVDGIEYIDCNMGHGPLILGHRAPVVVAALQDQIRRGNHYGPPSSREVDLAAYLVDGVPGGELAVFTNSGGESTMAAVRIARAATGRDKIAKFEGGLHGNYEPLLYNVFSVGGDADRPDVVADCAGLPDGIANSVVVLPFNDDRAFDLIREVGTELACVIVEPLQGSAGSIPAAPGFLEKLRAICDEIGALLIFDEVITAFRLGPGSAGKVLGVRPDLTTMGKAIGGGMPVGAVVGRAELIALTDSPAGGGFSEQVFVGGTFSGNPMTAAAGAAQLQELTSHPEHYDLLDRLGRRVRDGLHDMLGEFDLEGHVIGRGSIWGGPYLMEREPRSARDLLESNHFAERLLSIYLFGQGLLITSPSHLNFLSTTHTDDDVEAILGAHRVALARLVDEGVLAAA